MAGMRDITHRLGDTKDLVVWVTKGGAALDLTGKTIYFTWTDIDGVEPQITYDQTDARVTVLAGVTGKMTLHFLQRPTGVPTTGPSRFKVGVQVVASAVPLWEGSAIWSFVVPDEGLWPVRS